MIALLLSFWPAAAFAAELQSVFVWERPEDYFGGVSAIEVADDGMHFMAIGDNAQTLTGALRRDPDGRITGVDLDGPIGGLVGPDGVPLWRKKLRQFTDSEGLARLPDGGYAVSFENDNRVWIYPADGGPPTVTPAHPFFARLGRNTGLEALAVDTTGALWAIPEKFGRGDTVPVFRYADGAWDVAFDLPLRGRYRATGADFDDEGRLYVLERDFRIPFGFQTRIRRLTLGPDGIAGEETLLETRLGERDNLEGIALWRGGDGALRMTLVSDDNNSRFFQQTELVEYRLTD